ncbi:MAG: hypothetical protein M3O29_00835 [Actinomycetota bacterium]|nr:hypothetical protein [Actinomycetota bacterium]
MLGQRTIAWSIVFGAGLSAFAVSCTHAAETAPPTTGTTAPSPSTPEPSPSRPHSSAQPSPTPIPRTFDPKNFEAAGSDVNRWVPMAPGVQVIKRGFVNVGGRRIPHITVTTITDVTKKIDGVRAVLVLDQDFDGGQLSEQAVDYLAEDVGGNVWYLGSYTEAYEGGQFLNAQDAWLAGVNGAAAGLYFPGDPKPGSPPFFQVKVPGGEQSSAQVVKAGQRTCVPFDCFQDVVVVLEGGAENKYWAPGVGGILTEPLSGYAQETEELINVKELSPAALAELSAEVLKLDANAARTVPSVFGPSAPAVRER